MISSLFTFNHQYLIFYTKIQKHKFVLFGLSYNVSYQGYGI